MKAINSKLKKAVFGMMAAALTIGFSAFTTIETATFDTATYRYNLSSTNPIQENTESNWTMDDSTEGCNSTSDVLCTITAPVGTGLQPDFSNVSDVRTSPLISNITFKP